MNDYDRAKQAYHYFKSKCEREVNTERWYVLYDLSCLAMKAQFSALNRLMKA